MLKRIAIVVASTAASAVLAVGLVAAGFGPVAAPVADADEAAPPAAAAVVTIPAGEAAPVAVARGEVRLPRFVPVSYALPATPALAVGVWVPTPGIEAAPGAIAAAYAPIIQAEEEIVYIAPAPTPRVVHVVKRTRQAAASASDGSAGSSGGSDRSRASRRSDDDDDDEDEHEEREHEHEREDD